MKKAKGQQREEKAVSVAAGPIYRKIRRRYFFLFPLLSLSPFRFCNTFADFPFSLSWASRELKKRGRRHKNKICYAAKPFWCRRRKGRGKERENAMRKCQRNVKYWDNRSKWLHRFFIEFCNVQLMCIFLFSSQSQLCSTR